MFLLRAFLVWLVLIGVETAHGVLRTLLLVSDYPARQIGVLTGSVPIFVVTCVFIRWVGGCAHPAVTPAHISTGRCRLR